MRAQMEIKNPEDIEVTLTLTMTLGDWKSVCDDLGQKCPSAQFGDLLKSTVREVEKTFASGPQNIAT